MIRGLKIFSIFVLGSPGDRFSARPVCREVGEDIWGHNLAGFSSADEVQMTEIFSLVS